MDNLTQTEVELDPYRPDVPVMDNHPTYFMALFEWLLRKSDPKWDDGSGFCFTVGPDMPIFVELVSCEGELTAKVIEEAMVEDWGDPTLYRFTDETGKVTIVLNRSAGNMLRGGSLGVIPDDGVHVHCRVFFIDRGLRQAIRSILDTIDEGYEGSSAAALSLDDDGLVVELYYFQRYEARLREFRNQRAEN